MLLKLVSNTFWSRLMELANFSANLRSPLEFLDRHPVTVAPSTSLGEAIALMRRARNTCPLANAPPHSNATLKTSMSCVLVVEENQLVGVLGPPDVLNLAAESGWQEMPVADAMTRNLIVLKESEFTDIFTAFKLFCQHSIDCLPIVDERGQLVGSVSAEKIRPAMYSWIELLQQAAAKRTEEKGEVLDAQRQEAAAAGLRREEQLKLTLEFTRTASWQWQLATGKLTGNDSGFRLMGLRPGTDELNYRVWRDRVHPDDLDRVESALTGALENRSDYESEFRLISPEGKLYWLLERGRGIYSETGEAVEMVGISIDITDRKQAEIALQKLNAELEMRVQQRTQWYELAVSAGQVGIWDRNLETAEIYLDPSVKALLGYQDAEIPNCMENWTSLTHPDDRAVVEAAVNAYLDGVTEIFEVEHRMLHKDGSTCWIFARGTAVRSPEGKVCRLIGTDTDITDRKLTEEKLQNSEAELLALFNAMTDVVMVFHASGRCLKVAPTAPQLLYKPAAEVLGKTLAEIFPEAEANFLLGHIRQTLGSGETHRVEYSLEIEGKLIWFDGSVSPLGVDRVMWVARDITDRKQAEAALQKSEEKFRNLFDDAPIAICLASVRDYRIIKVNEAYRQILGYSDAELATMTFTDLTHPEDLQAKIDGIKQLVEGNISRFQMEKRLIKKNGELMWGNLTVTLIRDSDGPPLYTMAAIEDISDRKRAERELQQLKERLQFLLASNPAVIFTAAPGREFCTTYISDNVQAIVGYDPQEVLADSNFWSSRIHPEDLPQFIVNFSDLSENKNCICEYRFRHQDGIYRWLRTELKLLVDSSGIPIEIIGYAADISNSKHAEIALRQQFEQERLVSAIARRVRQSLELEEILNTTVAELQQVLLADRVLVYQILPESGGLVIAEAVAEGCSPLVNRCFGEEVFPAQSYQLYLQGRISAISELDDPSITPCVVEFMQQIEVRAKLVVPIIQHSQLWGLLIAHQCDGPREWQEWEINLFQQLVNQLAIAIQQSLLYQQLQAELIERKQAEANLKISLKEKEILLKEIHHRVKNNLCVVASLLELQSNTVADPQLALMFEESQNRLYSMALIHEKLYRSTNLAEINFGEYLEDLVTNLFHSYNISDNRIQLQVIAEPISLNLETATPCGLIANELVSNTLKHAFPHGTSGTVSVECYQTGDREIHLFVKDNGIGFPEELDFRKTNSMGFQVVCTLTDQLEGTIELSRKIGTAFHLIFNELNYFQRL
ncbi:PAS domain-containing protein [Microcoleus sp. A006_D1]|uniref:PAS domain-containing protein n=1 Tax=Microcoleus sp. A006_D1 TaxID=3055267 RepID=UPI002FCEE61D